MADTSISHLFFDDTGMDTTVVEFPNRAEGMLADLLAAASGPATASELSGEAQARAIFASTAATWSKPKRRIRPARMAVVAVSTASLLATTTTVLAAASVLPPPAANIVDKALRHVDINISPPVPSQIGGSVPTPARSDDVPTANPTPAVPSAPINVAQAAPPVQPASVDPTQSAQNPDLATYSKAVQAAAAAATEHAFTVSGTGTQNTGGSSNGGGATYMGGNQAGGSGNGSGSGSTQGGSGSTQGGQTIPVNQGGTPPTVTKGSTPPPVTKGGTQTQPPVTKGTPPSVVNQAPPTGSGEVAPTAGGNKVSGSVEQEVNGPGTQKSTPGGPTGTNKDETTSNQ